MIEVATYPAPLSEPYLELYGETRPLLCTDLTETLSISSPDDKTQMVAVPLIYEYFWTIGFSEDVRERVAHRPPEPTKDTSTPMDPTDITSRPTDIISKYDEFGAEIWLFFPMSAGWRVHEVVATVRHLRPLPHADNLTNKVAEYWSTVTPMISEAANLTRLIPSPGSAIMSSFLSMLPKLQITTLPPVDGFAWSVDKVTRSIGAEVMEGVHWRLPKRMFRELGNRLTGSIAVYFYLAQKQHEGVVGTSIDPQPKPILARAMIRDKEPLWIPYPPHNNEAKNEKGQDENLYVQLSLKPCKKEQNKRADIKEEKSISKRIARKVIDSMEFVNDPGLHKGNHSILKGIYTMVHQKWHN